MAIVTHVPTAPGAVTHAELGRAIAESSAGTGADSPPRPGSAKCDETAKSALEALLQSVWTQGELRAGGQLRGVSSSSSPALTQACRPNTPYSAGSARGMGVVTEIGKLPTVGEKPKQRGVIDRIDHRVHLGPSALAPQLFRRGLDLDDAFRNARVVSTSPLKTRLPSRLPGSRSADGAARDAVATTGAPAATRCPRMRAAGAPAGRWRRQRSSAGGRTRPASRRG